MNQIKQLAIDSLKISVIYKTLKIQTAVHGQQSERKLNTYECGTKGFPNRTK